MILSLPPDLLILCRWLRHSRFCASTCTTVSFHEPAYFMPFRACPGSGRMQAAACCFLRFAGPSEQLTCTQIAAGRFRPQVNTALQHCSSLRRTACRAAMAKLLWRGLHPCGWEMLGVLRLVTVIVTPRTCRNFLATVKPSKLLFPGLQLYSMLQRLRNDWSDGSLARPQSLTASEP